jgi:hypothetical protein
LGINGKGKGSSGDRFSLIHNRVPILDFGFWILDG